MPRKVPRGKRQLGIYVSEEIDKKLRELIFLKYGYYERGLLSKEVEEALRYWLGLHTQRHTNQPYVLNKVNPAPKARVVWERVREYLKSKWGFTPQQVTYADLAEAISAVRGNDPRTIRKWISEFMKYKLIKPIAPNVYELV